MPLFTVNYPEFRSDRIILRRPSITDVSELSMIFDHPLEEIQTGKMIRAFGEAWESGSEYVLGIISVNDQKLKGIIELYEYHEDTVMIGYRIIPAERNRGYASEAVSVLVHALIHEKGLRTVYAAAQADNTYSIQVLCHNGFVQMEEKNGRLLFAFHEDSAGKEKTDSDSQKTIWLAAGCFWGSEKAFRLLNGVRETRVGYANGTMKDPRYEDVCRGDTGFRETVEVRYDPRELSLETIMKAYFLCIDPTVFNRQGNDIGSQYQTGVYYTDDADRMILERIFAEEKKKYRQFAVELEPLQNFYPAEEYHQNYLDRNPGGYCHITKREFKAVKALNKKQ